jgi:DMSO/TMAO reductase YedYZ molybdopterin-dependent catalytic subunit
MNLKTKTFVEEDSVRINLKIRAFVAGIVGMVVAFGLTELIHGLYQPVPSVLMAIAQQIIRLTPGGFATKAIETLGKADTPILITFVVGATLLIAGFLAYLSLRSWVLPLIGVGILAAVAIVASFAEPFAAPIATVLTVVGALGIGSAVSGFLLHASGLLTLQSVSWPASTESGGNGSPSRSVRSREAHSDSGIAVNRRNFLVLSGGAALVGVAAAGVGRALSDGGGGQEASNPSPLELPESATSGSGAVTHQTLPPPSAEASIDAPGMLPLITPAKDFYLIDTNLSSPQINVDNWSLKIKGAVDNPIELGYKDLLAMSTREADITLSCVSNEVGGSLISNGRWTGVLLSDVLAEAGVSRDKIGSASEQLVGRSVDGWTSGFKTDLALDGREALVAFGLNGDQLPIKHGYPVRLVVPGLYGYVSATKWITEIELTNWDFDAYWIQRTWSKEGPIRTQSRIDTVKDGDRVSAGSVAVGGVAWAPHRGIERVQVSTDNGETWNEAKLADQLALDTWRQYVYNWEAKSGNYILKVRATDGEGETQTAEQTSPHPSGATGYHTVKVAVV